jgi:hypothetical protein
MNVPNLEQETELMAAFGTLLDLRISEDELV